MDVLDTSSSNSSEFDYLILCSGSDNRAYQSIRTIRLDKKTKVILVNFEERLCNKPSSDPIFEYRNLKIKNLDEINCAILSPASMLSELEAYRFNSNTKIAIDISCFTKPYFYYLIRLLNKRFNVQTVTVFYTEPKSYLFPKGLFTAFHSSSGSLKMIEMPGYVGRRKRDSKEKLVILLGFDADLSKRVNEVLEPSEMVLISGFPSYSSKFKDISLIVNESLITGENLALDKKIQVKYARANNPFEVYNVLETIKKAQENENIFLNVAPLGTKPMALGACLFALHNPEVRVVYPLPEKYDDKYSDKSWRTWLYALPLEL
jgi:hypothetical protein